MSRHPTEIATSHHKSGLPAGSFGFGTVVLGREYGTAVTLAAALTSTPFAMTVSFSSTRHSLPSLVRLHFERITRSQAVWLRVRRLTSAATCYCPTNQRTTRSSPR